MCCGDVLPSMFELAQTSWCGGSGHAGRRPIYRFSTRPVHLRLGWRHARFSTKEEDSRLRRFAQIACARTLGLPSRVLQYIENKGSIMEDFIVRSSCGASLPDPLYNVPVRCSIHASARHVSTTEAPRSAYERRLSRQGDLGIGNCPWIGNSPSSLESGMASLDRLGPARTASPNRVISYDF